MRSRQQKSLAALRASRHFLAPGPVAVASRQPGIINLPWDELWEPSALARRSWWHTQQQRALLETLADSGISEPLRVCRRARGGCELADGDSARLWFAAVGLIMTGRWAPDLCLPCREVPASNGFFYQGGLNV